MNECVANQEDRHREVAVREELTRFLRQWDTESTGLSVVPLQGERSCLVGSVPGTLSQAILFEPFGLLARSHAQHLRVGSTAIRSATGDHQHSTQVS